MKIKLDGREITVEDSSKNIVEIADDNGISITAPCFRSKKKNGCCGACIIEANNEEKFACTLKAQDGMEIIYNREDLQEKRKEKLQKYAQNIKSDRTENNQCCDASNSISSCGCSNSDCC